MFNQNYKRYNHAAIINYNAFPNEEMKHSTYFKSGLESDLESWLFSICKY